MCEGGVGRTWKGGGLRAGSPREGGRVLRGETAPKKEGRAPGVGVPRTGAQRGMGVMRGGRNPEPRRGGRVPKDLALGCVFHHSQATGSWGSSDGRFLNGQSIFRGGRPRTVFHRVTTAPSFTSPPLGGGSWSLVS